MASCSNIKSSDKKEIVITIRFGKGNLYHEEILRKVIISDSSGDEFFKKDDVQLFSKLVKNIDGAFSESLEGVELFEKKKFTYIFEVKLGKFSEKIVRELFLYPSEAYIKCCFSELEKAVSECVPFHFFPRGNNTEKTKTRISVKVSLLNKENEVVNEMRKNYARQYPVDRLEEKFEEIVRYLKIDHLKKY